MHYEVRGLCYDALLQGITKTLHDYIIYHQKMNQNFISMKREYGTAPLLGLLSKGGSEVCLNLVREIFQIARSIFAKNR